VDESCFTDTDSGGISDGLSFVLEVIIVEISRFGCELGKSGGAVMVDIFAVFVTAASFGMSIRFRGIKKRNGVLKIAFRRMRGNGGIQLLVVGLCSFILDGN
jgi:hypothetical protein